MVLLRFLRYKEADQSLQILGLSTTKTPNSKAAGLVFKHIFQVPSDRPATSSTIQQIYEILAKPKAAAELHLSRARPLIPESDSLGTI